MQLREDVKKWWDLDPAERHEAMVRGLRAMADFIEQNPEVRIPANMNMLCSQGTKEEMGHLASLAPYSEKIVDTSFFNLRVPFSENVYYELYNRRDEVCERVVTGTKIVPAQDARTEIIEHPAVAEHEEETFEWKCPSLLAPQEQK
jgi:hypothetical protein